MLYKCRSGMLPPRAMRRLSIGYGTSRCLSSAALTCKLDSDAQKKNDWQVRESAVDALVQVANPGCPFALNRMVGFLQDDDWRVRQVTSQLPLHPSVVGLAEGVRAGAGIGQSSWRAVCGLQGKHQAAANDLVDKMQSMHRDGRGGPVQSGNPQGHRLEHTREASLRVLPGKLGELVEQASAPALLDRLHDGSASPARGKELDQPPRHQRFADHTG
eukprot:755158-Hanusia_phi.AAC.3